MNQASIETMSEITLSSGARFPSVVGASILDSGAKAHISLPYSCRTGRCSTCKCKVVSGKTSALQEEFGLTAEERADGWILSCVRTAESDVVLEVEDLGGVVLPPAKTLPCRVNSIERLAHDVIRVRLRLPPAADFSYRPGQYVDVIGPAGVRRSYSLANASFAEKVLEFHIRAVEGGVMSEYWFNQAKSNDLLRLNGPLGTFFLRNVAEMDLIFMATGTGIAPVKAMLESIDDLPIEQRPKSVTVLWGGRCPSDLYIDLMSLPVEQKFIPVLSRAGDDWSGCRGHVQDVLLRSDLNLSNAAVYACGSDAMIRDASKALVAAGLLPQRFYSDAFVCTATPSSV